MTVRPGETASGAAMMADGYAPVFLIWTSDFLTTDRYLCGREDCDAPPLASATTAP